MEKDYKDLKWKFTFGKYKDQILKDVIKKDPDYVNWCLDNVSWFNVDDSLKKELKEYKKETRYRGSSYMPEDMDSEFQFMDFFGNY